MTNSERLTRRGFLRRSTAAVAAIGLGAGVRPRTALSVARTIGANDRIVLGLIGSGGMGTVDLLAAMKEPNVVAGAVCDLAEFRLKALIEKTRDQPGGPPKAVFGDYRPMLDDKNIDAVIIATPDHWHFQPFVDSIGADKHVYQQKPMCYTIEQGREMVRVAQAKPNLVVQIGTQRRSGRQYPKAKELIDQGRIGKVTYVRCWDTRNWSRNDPFTPRPFEGKLDWERFELPCKTKTRFDPYRYFAWRWYWEYAGGLVTDVGVHVMDVAHWLTGKDTPRDVVCNGGVYGLPYWQTPDVVNAVWNYGTHSVVFTANFNNGFHGDGLALYGTDATMEVQGHDIVVIAEHGKREVIARFASENSSHEGNWIRAIRGQEKVNAPVELGFKSLLPCLLANLAYRSGKKLSWDPQAEKVIGL